MGRCGTFATRPDAGRSALPGGRRGPAARGEPAGPEPDTGAELRPGLLTGAHSQARTSRAGGGTSRASEGFARIRTRLVKLDSA